MQLPSFKVLAQSPCCGSWVNQGCNNNAQPVQIKLRIPALWGQLVRNTRRLQRRKRQVQQALAYSWDGGQSSRVLCKLWAGCYFFGDEQQSQHAVGH